MNGLLYNINTKLIPGCIATYMVNAVIIQKLAYRFQLLNIPDTEIEKIDKELRKITKKKNWLHKNAWNDLLHDNQYGYGLMSLKETLQKRMLSEALVWLNKPGITQTILRAMANIITEKEGLPIDILRRPTELTKPITRNTYMGKLVETMILHKMAFKKYKDDDENITTKAEQTTYNTHARDWAKYKLTSITNIKNHNGKRTISFSNFVNGLPNSMRAKKRELLQLYDPPEWYTEFMRMITTDNITMESTHEITKVSIEEIGGIQDQIRDENGLTIWTDGSLKGKKMGAGIVIQNNLEHTIKEIATSAPPGNESSAQPEAWAIYEAMRIVETETKITIKTDSQNTINNINKIRTGALTIREKLKIENHDILDMIDNKCKRLRNEPLIEKVKAHTGIEGNERADTLAKLGTALETEGTNKLNTNLTISFINNEPAPTYPANTLKKMFQQNRNNILKDRITRRWEGRCGRTIDITHTRKLTQNKTGKRNPLDTSNQAQIKFRNEILTKELATMEKTKEWRTTADDTCIRCKKETETLDHVWECEKTIQDLEDIIKETEEIIDEQVKNAEMNQNAKTILERIKNNKDGFIRSDTAKGIIIVEEMKVYIRDINQGKKAFYEVIDAWLTAFHHIIWKERTKDVTKIIKEEKKKKEKIMNRLKKKKRLKNKLKETRTRKRKMSTNGKISKKRRTEINTTEQTKQTTRSNNAREPPDPKESTVDNDNQLRKIAKTKKQKNGRTRNRFSD